MPLALPALTRAFKLQDKAGRVGFDWNDPPLSLPRSAKRPTRSKRNSTAATQVQTAAEVGDLLFAVVNLARHLDADPEGVLRETNLKFERRFSGIERALAARGKTPKDASLAEMDRLGTKRKRPKRPPPLVISRSGSGRGCPCPTCPRLDRRFDLRGSRISVFHDLRIFRIGSYAERHSSILSHLSGQNF